MTKPAKSPVVARVWVVRCTGDCCQDGRPMYAGELCGTCRTNGAWSDGKPKEFTSIREARRDARFRGTAWKVFRRGRRQ